jgi:hypothetical protein
MSYMPFLIRTTKDRHDLGFRSCIAMALETGNPALHIFQEDRNAGKAYCYDMGQTLVERLIYRAGDRITIWTKANQEQPIGVSFSHTTGGRLLPTNMDCPRQRTPKLPPSGSKKEFKSSLAKVIGLHRDANGQFWKLQEKFYCSTPSSGFAFVLYYKLPSLSNRL